MPVKSKAKSNARQTAVRIDYPTPEEKLSSEHYAFRIQAEVEGPVEVSLDDGPWQPCRPAVGFWWYDFNGRTPGCGNPGPKRKHTLVARARGGNGEPVVSPVRRFQTAELIK